MKTREDIVRYCENQSNIVFYEHSGYSLEPSYLAKVSP